MSSPELKSKTEKSCTSWCQTSVSTTSSNLKPEGSIDNSNKMPCDIREWRYMHIVL